MTTKYKCKCKKCGSHYTIFKWERFISKHTFVTMFAIEDENDPSKNKEGIAVNHC